MSGSPYKSKKHLKRKSMELALTERRWFLFLSVVLSLTAAVSPFMGAHWPLPAGSGIGAAAAACASHLRR
jgi:hypothetical protein